MRTTNSAMWRTVFAEDIQVVEEMQKGQHTAYETGKFALAMPPHLLFSQMGGTSTF